MKHTFALYMRCHKSTQGFATYLTYIYNFMVHYIYLHLLSTVKICLVTYREKARKKFAHEITNCYFRVRVSFSISNIYQTVR